MGARDCIVSAVQVLLYRALQSRQSSPVTTKSTAKPCSIVLGPLVVLPPCHMLAHFIQLYATRIEPYLGLAGSSQIRIDDILDANMTDVGSLLVTLLIAQGAMLVDHYQSLIFADGLTEACRLAMNDILDTCSLLDGMVGGCALQLITLCAWSGTESFSAVSSSALPPRRY